jgi:hypothetical protein
MLRLTDGARDSVGRIAAAMARLVQFATSLRQQLDQFSVSTSQEVTITAAPLEHIS